MRFFFHYCLPGFTNCYVLGAEREDYPPQENFSETLPREAILVDPGSMDVEILNFIEKNNFTLIGVLCTHDHQHHIRGLKTLRKIYDVDIYGMNREIMDFPAIPVKDGEKFNIGPFQVEVISIPGHSSDSATFKIANMLFTGDALSAGLVGNAASYYGETIQMNALRSKLLTLPGDYLILPGHGPPSTLEAERRFNAGITLFEQQRNHKPKFSVEFFD